MTTIKITLYRAGDPSAVVDALLAAARAGKKVAALIELKARFDEEHNVGWARALETAGAHVVYGFVGLKVHAKIALVVRREGSTLRRYAHVGTGNYNTRSGRQYTDLSLFSASEALTCDVADLFNALTGSSRPPDGLTRGALVAPVQLLPSVLELIERETRHARASKPSGIRIKVNGLSDAEVVRALYRASEAGVRVELLVRGICTLRPGRRGPLGHDPRRLRRRPLPRALAHLPLRERRRSRVLHRLVGSAAAQPAPAGRAARAGARRRAPRAARSGPRSVPAGRHRLGPARRRPLRVLGQRWAVGAGDARRPGERHAVRFAYRRTDRLNTAIAIAERTASECAISRSPAPRSITARMISMKCITGIRLREPLRPRRHAVDRREQAAHEQVDDAR